MKCVTLFCDGSSLGNPGFGGWCAILSYEKHEKVIRGGMEYATNNQMELMALIMGLEALREPCEVLVVCDSKYVLDGIGKWIPNWIEKKFKDVKNPDLWQRYLNASQPHKIKTQWIKGHNGHPQNTMCDAIAKEEALKFKANL